MSLFGVSHKTASCFPLQINSEREVGLFFWESQAGTLESPMVVPNENYGHWLPSQRTEGKAWLQKIYMYSKEEDLRLIVGEGFIDTILIPTILVGPQNKQNVKQMRKIINTVYYIPFTLA